jgi:hypothetical protein
MRVLATPSKRMLRHKKRSSSSQALEEIGWSAKKIKGLNCKKEKGMKSESDEE